MNTEPQTKTLAIDQGTSSTRAVVVDAQGQIQVVHVKEHRQIYPGTGWVEHDPNELIDHIQQCLMSAPYVNAVGIDNQGESCLAWRADTKEALTPVIVWQDARAEPAVQKLKADGHECYALAVTGLPLESYFSASKLGWIMRNVPEAKTLHRQGLLRLGTTDAFFLDRLTDRYVTDTTTASRTGLMNLRECRWDHQLCDLYEVPIEVLPEIVSTTGDFGGVVVDGRSIPVTASVVDQQAALYGHGCREQGDAKVTFGTGAFALSVTGHSSFRAPEKGLLPTVAWHLAGDAPVYALDGGVYSASSALNWARRLRLFDEFVEINTFSKPPAIERDIVFVPALMGLACPYWDRSASGLWLGMSLDTSAKDLVQAILEGVAFRAAQVLLTMNQFVELSETVSVDGGMSVNPYFCQFFANILGHQICVPTVLETTALGTALLASSRATKIVCEDDRPTVYTPQSVDPGWRERFSEAVCRSRNWKEG